MAPASHTSDSTLALGARDSYLQCLLVLDDLSSRGLLALPSGQCAAYYRLVLRAASPDKVPVGGSVGQYRALQDMATAGPEVAISAGALDEAGSDMDIPIAGKAGRAPLLGQQVAGQLARPVSPARALGAEVTESSAGSSSSSTASSTSSVASSVSDDEVAPCTETLRPLPPGISLDEHLQPGQLGHYKRLLIKCPLAHSQHWDADRPCQKYRGLGEGQMRQFGQREPEAYLSAWAAGAGQFESRGAHVRWAPPVAAVRAAMRSLETA